MKKSIVLVVFSLVFAGCGQQVKEHSLGKMGEVKAKNGPAAGRPGALNLPDDKRSPAEIDAKEKQTMSVKAEDLETLERFLKTFIADVNKLSARLNLSQGSQFPPLHVEFSPIPSKILMVVAGSVLVVLTAVFGALLAAFFAWRTSLNMKMIEKKIRNSELDK